MSSQETFVEDGEKESNTPKNSKQKTIAYKASHSPKSLTQIVNSNTTFLYLGGWFGCRVGRVV